MTLQEALSYPLDKLVPANIAKTTITFLNEKEFESLAEHMKMSYSVKEDGYDTITIGQNVFKKTDGMKTFKTTEELIQEKNSFISAIPNNLGINLVSVKGIEYDHQGDGQLKEMKIVFIPAQEHKLANTISKDEQGIPKDNLTELIGVSKQEKTDDNFMVWDELFGILAWKFKPTESGDMFLDAEKVFKELKSKFELKKK